MEIVPLVEELVDGGIVGAPCGGTLGVEPGVPGTLGTPGVAGVFGVPGVETLGVTLSVGKCFTRILALLETR